MRTSQNGIDLIKRFEGLELESYQDIAGIWTIGYGHTGPEVGPDQRLSTDEAEALLRHDLVSREKAVSRLTRVDLNQNEFDALVSFVYNVGQNAYSRSTARRRLNAEDRMGAADALTWFNKATINGVLRPVAGLTRRRAAEKALFLTPIEQLASQPENVDDNARVTPMEDAPRRGSIGDSRTMQGAAVAGGAGATAANMGRDASEELDDLEHQIERGEGLTVDPATDEEGTDFAGGEAGDETENETGDETGEENNGADAGGSPDGETPEVDDSDDGADPLPEFDDPVIEDDTGEIIPPLDGSGTVVEQPANRPAVHPKHEADAQIQLALMVIIILAILYIVFARIDDWFNYRR
ncbi:MAG: glycoside hydrolase family protein [Pseudomonadota bacterium]